MGLLLMTVALTTRQPPPPAIAQFAPQAVQQIKQAPKEQASQFGSGRGPGDCPPGTRCGVGTGPGAATPPPKGSPSPTASPRPQPPGLPCVGNPPRQIEDPQSPPCISTWDDSKGNGGATAPGVTATEIKIYVTQWDQYDMYKAFAAFFNARFQLYGRKITLLGNAQTNNQKTGIAAADAAKQMGAFAATVSYSDVPFYRELVKNKIIGVYRTTDFDDKELAASSPYLWGYPMQFDEIQRNLADWTCRRLVGTPARHAGSNGVESMSQQPRTFGIFLEQATADSRLSAKLLAEGIKACGGKVNGVFTYLRENNAARDRSNIAQLKSLKTTTNFCLCQSPNLVSLQTQAATQQYQPEWVITSYPQFVSSDGYNGPQMSRTFGVRFEPMSRVKEDHPSKWALDQGDPGGAHDPIWNTATIESNDIHYRGFLMLASGLQMAGPHLTPETFKEGLWKAQFPNPYHPIMAGTVGFDEHDYSMTNDGAEFWYSRNDSGPYSDTQNGPTWCYVDHGRRHKIGTWPKGGDPFFKEPCDSGNRSVS